jgi:hypothetical protein
MKAFDMLLDPCTSRQGPLVRALTRAVEPFAAELRLVDAKDFVAYIHEDKLANIQDIVNSSAELFFKPGTLSFGWGADVEIDWNSAPTVALDMELRHRSVWLVFKLILRALQTEVIVEHVTLRKPAGSSSQDLELLLETINDARLGLDGQQIIPH